VATESSLGKKSAGLGDRPPPLAPWRRPAARRHQTPGKNRPAWADPPAAPVVAGALLKDPGVLLKDPGLPLLFFCLGPFPNAALHAVRSCKLAHLIKNQKRR